MAHRIHWREGRQHRTADEIRQLIAEDREKRQPWLKRIVRKLKSGKGIA